MNNQLQRQKFVEETSQLILDMGGSRLNDNEFEILGSNGSIILTVRDAITHKELYSIFGRFSYLNDLTGRTNCKYNFHSMKQDQEIYLSEIVNELNR